MIIGINDLSSETSWDCLSQCCCWEYRDTFFSYFFSNLCCSI